MKSPKPLFFGLLCFSGLFLLVVVLSQRMHTPFSATFAPLFSLAGRTFKTADRLMSRVIPVGEIDEKTLGDAFAARMEDQGKSEDRRYLGTLVREVGKQGDKPFTYRAYIQEGAPNAFSLPGGVVVVTTELLDTLTSEAQLISVLAHEVGHIERGHCFDSVRFQMLAQKVDGKPLGEIIDAVYELVLRSTFSKTQEEEADRYAFDTLQSMGYDPAQMSVAFENLQKSYVNPSQDHALNPFRDYFASHPPIELRIENYRELAGRWHQRNPKKLAYVGVRNFRERRPRSKKFYSEEEG